MKTLIKCLTNPQTNGEFFAGAMIIGVVGSGILGMIAIILLSL